MRPLTISAVLFVTLLMPLQASSGDLLNPYESSTLPKAAKPVRDEVRTKYSACMKDRVTEEVQANPMTTVPLFTPRRRCGALLSPLADYLIAAGATEASVEHEVRLVQTGVDSEMSALARRLQGYRFGG